MRFSPKFAPSTAFGAACVAAVLSCTALQAQALPLEPQWFCADAEAGLELEIIGLRPTNSQGHLRGPATVIVRSEEGEQVRRAATRFKVRRGTPARIG